MMVLGTYTIPHMEENRVSPTVLSYEELSAGKGDSPEITCVVTAPERLTSETSYGFLGPAIYEKANPQGPIGPTQMMFFPLNMDLSTGDSRITRKEYTTAYQGISYIGAANMNTQQLWTIDGLTLGQRYQFILTAVAVGGEIGGDFVARVAGERATIAQNAQHTFNNASPDSMEWVIESLLPSRIPSSCCSATITKARTIIISPPNLLNSGLVPDTQAPGSMVPRYLSGRPFDILIP